MSDDMREEIEITHEHRVKAAARWKTFPLHSFGNDIGARLEAVVEANREKDAEIARLNRIVACAKSDRLGMKAKLDAFNSGGFADADAMAGKYLEEKAIVDRVWAALGISTYEQAGGKAIDEIVASLRSGEKPEDAWNRGWTSGWNSCFNKHPSYHPKPYVAPPTEKES